MASGLFVNMQMRSACCGPSEEGLESLCSPYRESDCEIFIRCSG